LKIYLGATGWGWRLFGIGYKSKWFLGFSMRDDADRSPEGRWVGAKEYCEDGAT
jgi:hypothetical protein